MRRGVCDSLVRCAVGNFCRHMLLSHRACRTTRAGSSTGTGAGGLPAWAVTKSVARRTRRSCARTRAKRVAGCIDDDVLDEVGEAATQQPRRYVLLEVGETVVAAAEHEQRCDPTSGDGREVACQAIRHRLWQRDTDANGDASRQSARDDARERRIGGAPAQRLDPLRRIAERLLILIESAAVPQPLLVGFTQIERRVD